MGREIMQLRSELAQLRPPRRHRVLRALCWLLTGLILGLLISSL